jgi:CAAX protease family protein
MLHAFLSGHTGFDFLLLFLAALAMPALSALTGRQLAAQSGVPLIRRYWMTVLRGWLVVALILFAWAWAKRPFATLGLDWPIGFWGRVGFVAVAIVALVFFAQLARLPKLVGENLDRWAERMEALKITPRTRAELLLFILVAITAGVWEELLYRGFFIWFLLPVTGVVGAVVISSLIFGIGHIYQGRYGVLNTGLVGLVFAIVYLLSQSLWWLMAAHAVVDIYGGALAYRLTNMRDEAVKFS